jgi:ribosomal protein L7Ae-like RNA K-turn-binding protein
MAIKKKAFARAFKAETKTPPSLGEDVDRLLERAARESFSLANKAGQVVAGFGKVEEALGRGQVLAVLHASDAADDGVRKVGQLVRRSMEAGANEIKIITSLPSDDLGLALGRSHVIHAALLGGSAALACVARMEFLEAYRAADDAAHGFETQVTQPN